MAVYCNSVTVAHGASATIELPKFIKVSALFLTYPIASTAMMVGITEKVTSSNVISVNTYAPHLQLKYGISFKDPYVYISNLSGAQWDISYTIIFEFEKKMK